MSDFWIWIREYYKNKSIRASWTFLEYVKVGWQLRKDK